ncbi:DUF1223 domain-containing protein [Phreatobacter stygius]|uniref:DUF1223 domain-containing protein n=1 Tax=Phreatobacter stygius TaxID=1940610 RepID=A0A4D7B933_9HYPH|nr:DUF1223 domain-containing protein [Phreatobacter stygius]QCI64607.1 DUF1223 domain-containing protein [Phreatobacter stygius]
MHKAKIWGGLLLGLVSLGAAPAAAADKVGAVIELFTSQGCSSCPPADRHLAEIADRTDVIALTFAVDYWDYLGWRDTLADPANTKRQKAYAYARGDRQVYTPQMVINGVTHAIGSDRPAVERAMVQSAGQSGALSVPVTISYSGDTVTVTLPAQQGTLVSAETPATVLLLGVSSRQAVEIARGENRGNSVTYRNVVRSHVKLGEWTGGAQTFTASRLERLAPGCERAVVLIQAGSQRNLGAVLGAAMARFQ